MRTKSLVLAAALSAAGIASTYAQSVYSVNAVGYVNVTVGNGFSMIANPLATTNNTVAQLFAAAPEGTIIMTWNQSVGSFDQNAMSFGNWDFPDATLSPGQGVLFQNSSGSPFTITFVGEVMQGTNLSVALNPGFNMVSSKVPQAGGIQTDLGFVPEEGDIVMKWNQSVGSYDSWSVSFGSWDPAEPVLAVGESAFIQPASAKSWVRSFSIN